MSVTSFPNRKGNRYACGVVCLLFAERLVNTVEYNIMTKCCVQEFLSHEMYEIVSYSLREGLDTYTANYGNKSQRLYAEDILLLVSHLGLNLVVETVLPSVSVEHLAMCIYPVRKGQIILFIRSDNYNVWCVVHHNNCQEIIILDCQSHKVFDCVQSKEVQYGGMIYRISLSYDAILQTLLVMEKYSGPFTGPYKVAVIQV